MMTKLGSGWYAWGYNYYGQLRDGTTTNKSTPVEIIDSAEWEVIVAGDNYAIGKKNDGKWYAWGRNNRGQLGDGTNTNRITPVEMVVSEGWEVIVAGHYHTIGKKNDGKWYAWGYNYYGQLGDGTTTNKSTPVEINDSTAWEVIVAGGEHTIGKKNDGKWYAWGLNNCGQLGDGTTTNKSTPVEINDSAAWEIIVAGGDHNIGKKNDGKWYAWGWNRDGQLGDGTTTNKSTPVEINDSAAWEVIVAGFNHTIGKKNNGKWYAWGRNDYGQLGNGTTTNTSTPTEIIDSAEWEVIVAGHYHTIGKKNDGKWYAWGRNNCGQLGDGTTTNKSTPVEMVISEGWDDIICGSNHVFGHVFGLSKTTIYLETIPPKSCFTMSWNSNQELSALASISNDGQTILNSTFLSTDGGKNWRSLTEVNIHQHTGKIVTTMSGDGSKMVVLVDHNSEGCINFSNDSGNTWKEIGTWSLSVEQSYVPYWYTASMSNSGSTMLVGGEAYYHNNYEGGGGLFISNDYGENWREIVIDDQRKWIASCTSSSSVVDGLVMLASSTPGGYPPSGSNKLYISNNSGHTWSEVQPIGNIEKKWTALAISNDGYTIVAGTDDGLLCLSKNAGETWQKVTQLSNLGASWTKPAISTDGSLIVIGSGNDVGLYASTNGGNTWFRIPKPPGAITDSWRGVCMTPDASTILVGESRGVFISRGDLSKWHVLCGYTASSGLASVIAASKDGSTILTHKWLSTDYGYTWSTINHSNSVKAISADGMVMMSGGKYSSRLYISKDRGETWTETRPRGDTTSTYPGIAISHDGSRIVVTSLLDVFISTDFGETWISKNPGGYVPESWYNTNYESCSMTPDGMTIFVTRDNSEFDDKHVHISNDGGSTWTGYYVGQWVSDGLQYSDVSDDGQIMVVGNHWNNAYVFLSKDSGKTWSRLQLPGFSGDTRTVSVSSDGEQIIVGRGDTMGDGGGGVFDYSDDFGETWINLDKFHCEGHDINMGSSFAFDDSIFYIGSSGSSLYRGTTLKQLALPPQNKYSKFKNIQLSYDKNKYDLEHSINNGPYTDYNKPITIHDDTKIETRLIDKQTQEILKEEIYDYEIHAPIFPNWAGVTHLLPKSEGIGIMTPALLYRDDVCYFERDNKIYSTIDFKSYEKVFEGEINPVHINSIKHLPSFKFSETVYPFVFVGNSTINIGGVDEKTIVIGFSQTGEKDSWLMISFNVSSTAPSTYSDTLFDMAHDSVNNNFVAVGSNGLAIQSNDGLQTVYSLDDLTDIFGCDESGTVCEEHHINTICYSHEKELWLAGGRKGKAAYSTDGIVWSEFGPDKDYDILFGENYITKIRYIPETYRFWTLGLNKICYSSDGLTWDEEYVSTTDEISFSDIVYYKDKNDNELLIVVGTDHDNQKPVMMYRTIDGVSYTWYRFNDSDFRFTGDFDINAIEVSGNKFVIKGWGSISITKMYENIKSVNDKVIIFTPSNNKESVPKIGEFRLCDMKKIDGVVND